MLKVSRLVFAATLVAATSPIPPALAAPFGIVSLGNTGSAVVEHDAVTNDDRGGIAVSAARVFYTGDGVTGRFAITDLTGGASTGQRYDALAGNIRTGDVYAFGEGPSPAQGGDVADRLLLINGTTGALAGTSIMLSSPIAFTTDIGQGIFSGSDRIVVIVSNNAYSIALPSGTVTNLGAVAPLQAYPCESWFYWGVVEEMNSQIYVTYRDVNSDRILRTRLSTGVTTLVASFTELSDLCTFTVWPTLNRWYFHHEGHSQFGGAFETLGYASATFATSFSDTDGDGPVNFGDNCPTTANANQADADGDFIGDACDPCPNDPDVDGDGACEDDNCPVTANPGQEDADDDGFGDLCDFCAGPGTQDYDSDGTCDTYDNCLYEPNPDQADLDEDGEGDLCDSRDNVLVVRSGGIQAKTDGLSIAAKGSVTQTESLLDIPDSSEGVYVGIADNAYSFVELSFAPAECEQTEARVLCKTIDGSAQLQIKTKNAAKGKMPFTFKMKTPGGAPPFYLGPLYVQITDYATSVDRQGEAGVCSTTPSKLSCK